MIFSYIMSGITLVISILLIAGSLIDLIKKVKEEEKRGDQ